METKRKHLLYDGDFLKYAIGFANEKFKVLYGGEPLFESGSMLECQEYCNSSGIELSTVEIKRVASPIAYCLASVKRAIQAAMRQTGADTITVYVSGSSNFRTGIAKQKEYKGNRKDLVKPLHHDAIVSYLLKRYKAVMTQGIEADDALAIRAMELKEAGIEEPIIATADKDLMQVPVKIWNVQTGDITDVGADPFGELTLKAHGSGAVLKGYGAKFFYAQVLTGDVVDNIGGLAKCGAKNAFKLLAEAPDEETCQQIVLEQYKKKYGEEMKERVAWNGTKYTGNYLDMLDETCRLLWMLRKRPNKDGSHKFKPWWE